VKKHVFEVLGMKKLSLRWVRHEPTAAQKAQRVVDSQKWLRVLRADAANGFVNKTTADENLPDWSYDHSLQWNTPRDLVPTRALKKTDSHRSMLTVVFNGYGLFALDDLPKGLKMNSQFFCVVVLEEARQAAMAITKERRIEKMMIQLHNCKIHCSAKITKKSEEFQVTRSPRPAHSPNISPCNFWFAG
jgi:hypothetical protein